MQKIGLLSDTHSYFDPQLKDFFKDCNQIWHAGDIGDYEIVKILKNLKPLKAVYGNIDGMDIRKEFPEKIRFKCDEVDVLITHIGGYPGKYYSKIKDELLSNSPNLFICGHSHILKIIYDKKLNFLHINPGAAGRTGRHKVRTAVRFNIDKEKIMNVEIVELGRTTLTIQNI